jgi:translation initiation factor 1 (eIF-1/SUI1)
LEENLSMPELSAILKATRDKAHEERKFSAAIQGIDLDAAQGQQEDAWEKLKAKVASGGKAADSKDILGLQGAAAQKAGFGIGMGLDFEDLTAPAEAGGENN